MNVAVKQNDIIRKISHLGEIELKKLESYLDQFITDEKSTANQSLKGIWRNAGFEVIDDLESDLKHQQIELQDSILKKV